MQFKVIYLTICSLLITIQTTRAESIEICGDLKQGELILIKDKSAKRINIKNNLGKKNYQPTADGITLVALHRDAPSKVEFDAVLRTDYVTHYVQDVAPAQWDIQRINGITSSKVTPTSATDLHEIKREQKDVGRSVTHFETGNAWRKGFILPIEGRISGNFGNQRIFNGIPKSPHSGTDIAAPEGTPVKASGDGKVILSGKDYFYTGNMVIIDHGQGLQTIYAHLKEAKVREGDTVRQGDIIGLVGKTGRSTGPHLHWGASLNNVRFRPHSLLDINTKKCRKIEGKHIEK
ncbi:MAG: M23 family metallopeptidase [Alphaproteobacteria bacterium]|nr:M23 family metallopeptidase [Alphaproteobacteria bacterium]